MRSASRIAVALLIAAGAASCGLDKQAAPPLAGPSEYATSITLEARPDVLVQDGESVATITARVRDLNGQPIANRELQFSGTSSSGLIRSVSFTESIVFTDASGVASTGLIAPPAPATVPTVDPVITVRVAPREINLANTIDRTVQVRLLAPAGTPLSNQDPVAVIVADPRVANFGDTVRFDASLTTDEGQACGSRCTYIWEFGDNTVAVKAITAEHVYDLPGTYVATLTVTDDRGGVDTATVDIRIIGPTAPIANFTVTPSSPTAGAAATFNASSSSVGAGATISQYAWDFGDGTATVTTGSATTMHTFALAGSYTVTLTVTDDLGRTATRTATVTVQ